MKFQTMKLEQKPSRYGGHFYYLFLKREDGASFRTCLYPNMRNYGRWASVVESVQRGTHVWLTGLIEKGKGMIDADSQVFTTGPV